MFIRALSVLVAGFSVFLAGFASAQDKPMKLESAVQLVMAAEGADGEPRLVEAKNVVPGDTLVFTTSFRNQGGAAIKDFVIVNPVPADVQLADEPGSEAEVSIDGAKTWGRLGDLTVAEVNGQKRPATIEDITHLRWAFTEIPSGKTGRVRFSATVR